MIFQQYEKIKTVALTNDVFVIEAFIRELADNGELGDARITLECAPTTDGMQIAYYLRTNGDPVPFALQNENGIHWGNEAFGRGFDCSEWLPDYADWLSGYSFRDRLNFARDANIRAFADALDEMQEQLSEIAVKVTLEDGNYFVASINTDLEGAKAYYRDFVVVRECELTGKETKRRVVAVEPVGSTHFKQES